MPQGIVKLDINMILNLIKNDRQFTITKGVPRDAYAVKTEYCEKGGILIITVESEGIDKTADGAIPKIEIELFGNADAFDEFGELKALKPAIFVVG